MGQINKLPAHAAMHEFLSRAMPGRSTRAQELRDQILDFSSSPLAKSVLIRGPIGVGKSTTARMIGLLRRIAPLRSDEAARMADDARFERERRNLIDINYLPWYVELALTGLVETLADVQLFGNTKGAFTGAFRESHGVFEQAMNGRGQGTKVATGSNLTGGIVFLDEIGDLSPVLQAKLLPVLSGGMFYRIGGEGNDEHGFSFSGVTITASWKNLDAKTIRPDLLSRVTQYVIDVPSIADRMEDFDEMFKEVQLGLLESTREVIDRLLVVDPNVDRAYWTERKRLLEPVKDDVRQLFAKVDWDRHGNLRGLTAALERALTTDREPEDILASLPITAASDGNVNSGVGSDLISKLLQRDGAQGGLAGHVRALEVEARASLKDRLLTDRTLRRRLAEKLGVAPAQLQSQIHELDRRRNKVAK